MNRLLAIGFALTMLSGCERSRSVRAGNDDYQPRAAPENSINLKKNEAIQGEVVAVDMKERTIVIRTENGTEQTLNWNKDTRVTGRAGSMKILSVATPGSPVDIRTIDDKGRRTATTIEVKANCEHPGPGHSAISPSC